MKKSLSHRIKFYLLLATSAILLILTIRKFVIPATQVVQEYLKGKKQLERSIRNPEKSTYLTAKYENIQKGLGVSNLPGDILQIKMFTDLEKCASLHRVEISEALANPTTTLSLYTLHLHDITMNGNYANLLKTLNCLEENLEYGIISTVKFEKKKKQDDLTLQITVQNFVLL